MAEASPRTTSKRARKAPKKMSDAADEDDLAPGLGVAEAEHRLQRAGGGGEDGEEKADAAHALLSHRAARRGPSPPERAAG